MPRATRWSILRIPTGSGLDDTLEGNGANNVLNGGAGTDTVSYEHAGAAVTVSWR